ncbi:hypothetical protein QFZ72_004002 [Bacillus sp. V2I10]|nr:hypothetical protein [Bacillus sp. V2I10]
MDKFIDKPHLEFRYKGYGTDTFGEKTVEAPNTQVGSVVVNAPKNENKITSFQDWLNDNYKVGIKEDGLFGPKTKKAAGSMLGAWTVHMMNPEVLKPLMLIMLAAVAVYTIFKKDWGSISTYKKLSTRNFIIFMVLIFAIGFYDGFLGPGTGSFLIFVFLNDWI